MNVIYNNCFADPWVEVAKVLKAEFDLRPAYWTGYADDDSKKIIPEAFPEAVYHNYFNAWKGVFPSNIEDLAQNYCVELDFYKKIAQYEIQGLNIMDRMDMDWQSFSFSERRMLFRKLLRYWLTIIDHYKIEFLISSTITHQSFDFPLYLACKEKGIKTISFVSTPFSKAGRIIGISDIYQLPEKIKRDYENVDRNKGITPLAEDIHIYIDRIHKSYKEAEPENFKDYNRFHRKKPSVIMTGRKFSYEFFTKKSVWLGSDGWLLKGVPSYTKEKKKDVEKSRIRLNLISYIFKIYKRIRYLKSLKREYSRISVTPDLNTKYVVFALHYQPEATTAPRAGYFADQLYIVELLSKYLPLDWRIYIKENPKQFNPASEGNTGRMLRFYRDALKFPRVSFVPVETNPFKLIDQAKAVITVGGTIGWEGMVRRKPVICFSQSWYEYFTHGVLRIKDKDDLEKMTDFIKNYQYNEQELNIYLKTIESNSFTAYFRRGLKSVMNMSEEECVDSLVNNVTDHFGLITKKK